LQEGVGVVLFFLEHGSMEKQYRTKYPSDVSDAEWAFVAPYLTLCREDAPQREHALRAVFNGLRYIVRTGNQWRFMPGDLPPWVVVYQQTQRWMRAGVFVLLPRRWVVERSFAWAARFRRLARDYERLSDSLAGYHNFAFAWLMLAQLCKLLNGSS
jgi:transposase